jgi:HEPN domain-containing protein/predicted nucleotidyltransferase
MRKSLSHLPERKRQELAKARELILAVLPEGVEMIILFGSHARGNWVEDIHEEDDHICEYKSDYDILVLVRNVYKYHNKGYELTIQRRAAEFTETAVNVIIHSLKEVNQALRENRYFFADIKQDGIVLHNPNEQRLAKRRNATPEQRREIAKEEFEKWFPSAKGFFRLYELGLQEKLLNHSAFNLHQAVEHACHALLLVFTGYKPKEHDLDILKKSAARFCPELESVFPQGTDEEKRLWDLLKKAYIDARYKKNYKITERELAYLAPKVERFQSLIEAACKEKLANFNTEASGAEPPVKGL